MHVTNNRGIGPGRAWTAVVLTLLLTGCTSAHPPYVVLFNSYFPSWLLCATIGCIAALIARVVLVRLGIDECLPFPFLVYVSIAAAVMFSISLLVFAR